MNALRVKAVALALLGLCTAPLLAQTANFDDKPTGFLTVRTGGMPADSWAGTPLATAKRLVSALPAAPRSRALRDLQFKVLVSELAPPAPDGSPPPSLFARKVEKLAAMGEGESLNEMVRNAGGYVDPAIASTVANALMMAGERQGACAIVRNWQMTEPFGRRADAACKLLAGESAGAIAPSGQIDGPAFMMLAMSNGQPPAAWLSSTQPPAIRALVGLKSLPIATRLDIGERGEAAWRPLRRSGARRGGAAAGHGAARPAGRGGTQRVQSGRDRQLHHRVVQRCAGQSLVPDHRPGERGGPA